MKRTYRNILLTILSFGTMAALTSSYFSTDVALGVFTGNSLMTLNLWVLMKALSSIFNNDNPALVKSAILLLTKTVGLFALCYVCVVVWKIDTLALGLSAAGTTLAFSLAMTLFNPKSEVLA